MNALKREKKNKAFFCNNKAEIINEICGISRRQILNFK